ncbi:hypothetical protein BKD30_11075 [Tersicoccus phoenicis]|uniref:DUF5666 domain-containing protein n=1 Tax=Tersicoccus phoenicis TaxID=554083 RepID=A0A1R1L8P6_9MICC|nr:hypothetical protein [Tersicoccus phoenicis]OMH23894.1 hypothetical protein BKD30_11075 [Tersicoccus phoenicis]
MAVPAGVVGLTVLIQGEIMHDFETPTSDRQPAPRGTTTGTRSWAGSTGRWIATGLLTLGLAGAGGVAVIAAGNGTSGPATNGTGVTGASTTPTASTPASGPDRQPRAQHRGAWFPIAPARAPLHGEFVLPQGQGNTTVLVQRGRIAAVSDTSVTVKSADGYTATYALGTSSRLFAAPERPLRTPNAGPRPKSGPNAGSGSSAGPGAGPSAGPNSTPTATPSAGTDPDPRAGGSRHRTVIAAADLKVGDRVALMAAKTSTTPTVQRLLVLPAGAGRSLPAPDPGAPSVKSATPAPTGSTT